jgi:putative hydrolase
MILQDLHSHSNWSDGENTVEEMVNAAINIGLKRFAITDHVWRSSPWVWDYLKECHKIKEKYRGKIEILCGFEAKCLNRDGSIDILDEVAKEADIVLGAIHRIPEGENKFFTREEIYKEPARAFNFWLESTLNMLSNPKVTTVAHVTAALNKYALDRFLSLKEATVLLNKFITYSKEVELNIRHSDPVFMLKELIKKQKAKTHIGTDSHSVKELYSYWYMLLKKDGD